MNHLLLHSLTRLVGPGLVRRRIDGVRLLAPLVVTTLAARGGKHVYLVAVLSAPGPFLYLDDEDPLRGAGAPIFRRVGGARVSAGPVASDDRALLLPLTMPASSGGRDSDDDSGDGWALSIVVHGSSARVRLLRQGKIIDSLDPSEAGQPVPVGSPRGRLLRLATAKPQAIGQVLEKDGVRPLAGTDNAAVAWAAAMSAAPRPATAEDRAPTADHASTTDRAPTSDGARAADHASTARERAPTAEDLVKFRDEVIGGGPVALTRENRLGAAAVVPTGAIGARRPAPRSDAAGTPGASGDDDVLGPFESAEEACRDVGRMCAEQARTAIIERLAAPLIRHLRGREKLRDKLEAELATAKDPDRVRREADILAAYQSRVPSGAKEVVLPDPYEAGMERRIELDPALPVTDQIEKRYRRVAKLERSREQLEGRLHLVRGEISDLETIAAPSDEPFQDMVAAFQQATERFGLDRRAVARPKRRTSTEKTYRRYDVHPEWFVLVGRGDKENDEITFKVARPDDIWMHAQQVAGSHVVLKSSGAAGNPPQQVLEAAAAIAAWYSKAKNSRVVPVIYTLRKYVRKFRGANPGQVTCEREKTVFVEPGLPDERQ